MGELAGVGRLGTLLAVAALGWAVVACSDGTATAPMVTDDAGPSTTSSAPEATDPPAPTTAPSTADGDPDSTLVPWPEPAECAEEVDGMLAAVDAVLTAAGFTTGTWSEDVTDSEFAARTHPSDEFRYRLGLDCGVRAVASTPDGSEVFVVGAWTGPRHGFVVQTSAEPATPYGTAIRFQLFIDQVDGQWLIGDEVWAGTRDNGETVIVATDDTSTGVTAKAWYADVPRFDDLEVTIEAEQVAIDLLERAGARTGSVAEPADFGSELAAVQFITPAGLHAFATVGPTDWFDPAAELFEGERSVETVGGVEVYVTEGAPEAYATGSVGWECGGYVWYVETTWGTVDELVDVARTLIDIADC